MHKFSVIVYLNNYQSNIYNCLNSVISKNVNYEMVIVDDNSRDDSLNEINRFRNDNRNIDFSLIKNDKYIGFNSSINKALDKCNGEYVLFLDGNDMLSKNYLSTINEIIGDVDILITDVYVVNEDSALSDEVVKSKNDNYDNKMMFINTTYAINVWNKVIKKKLINERRLDNKISNNSCSFIIPIMIETDNIKYIDDVYYVHYKSSNNNVSEDKFDIFKSLNDVKEYCTSEMFDALVFNYLTLFLFFEINGVFNKNDRYKLIKKFCFNLKKYKIKLNSKTFNNFLNCFDLLHKRLYSLIVKMVSLGLARMTNMIVSLYYYYRTNMTERINFTDVTSELLIETGKYNQSLKDNKFSLSVVIPCCNDLKYLLNRIYSVLYQTIKIDEIIIIDNCSNDGSLELLNEIKKDLDNIIDFRIVENKNRSNSIYKQWQKGINLAKSDYVWIAETSDYTYPNYLERVMDKIDNKTYISYCMSKMINDNNEVIMKSMESIIDQTDNLHYIANFKVDGKNEFNEYSYLNNTIPCISSCVIKKDNYDKLFADAVKYSRYGEWVLFSGIMQLGNVCYTNEILNCYRMSTGNVSSNLERKDNFIEIKKIYDYFDAVYGLNKKQKDNINCRCEYLKKEWNVKD